MRASSSGEEMSTSRDIKAGEPKIPFWPPYYTIYNYINDMPQTPSVYLGLFAYT
jgi:hypothetical protein